MRLRVAGLLSLLVAGRLAAHPGLQHDIDTLTLLIAQDPINPRNYVERADRLRRLSRLDEALCDLETAEWLSPRDATIALERGWVFSALRRDIEADAEFSRAFALDGGTAPALAERARVRSRLGRFEEALADYTAALAREPDPDVYLARGALLATLHRPDAAAAGYREGLSRLQGAASLRTALLHLTGSLADVPEPLPVPRTVVLAARSSAATDSFVGLVREPYLQSGTPTSMTVVWRTSTPSDSRVRFGTAPGSLVWEVVDASVVTDHVVTLAGLSPATRYWYDVGSNTEVQAGGTSEHFFATSPEAGSATPFRAWILGDSGNGSAAQLAVRDAMLSVTAGQRPDLFLHLGDIAYIAGTDAEFDAYHFLPYREILRNTVLWTTLGNHEGLSTTSGEPGPVSGPYYSAFVLPTGGEAGGAPSGTEAYYSFDYANVHFVCLNSYQVSRSATGAMAIWLEADLAANTQPWIVAFFHHPPYTRGTHDSDVEIEHVQMRENLLPILEAGGVDLVLGGHSHGYERSFLLDGTYVTPTPPFEALVANGNLLDLRAGNAATTGPYRKDPGVNPHQGAVFVVAGHGGADTGGVFGHPVMYTGEALHGSVLLDVAGDSITVTNVRSTGVTGDTFTLVKRTACSGDYDCQFMSSGCNAGRCTFGGCVSVVLPDGAACDAADPCAQDGHCNQGICAGEVTGLEEVRHLRWEADKVTLAWDPTLGDGPYDVAGGLIKDFSSGEAPACIASNVATTSVPVTSDPTSGDAAWYLARGDSTCGRGTWGFSWMGGARGPERIISACP